MTFEPIWGAIIAWYLFLAGLGGGAFVTSAFLGWRHPEAVSMRKIGHLVAPIVVIIGLCLLMFDAKAGLMNPLRFALLLTNFGSVMTWGVVFLGGFTVISLVVVVLDFVKKRVPVWLDIAGVVFGVAVAMYTGALLGVCKTFPLWNNALLPILFLVSAMSTGAASVLLIGIGCELFDIVTWILFVDLAQRREDAGGRYRVFGQGVAATLCGMGLGYLVGGELHARLLAESVQMSTVGILCVTVLVVTAFLVIPEGTIAQVVGRRGRLRGGERDGEEGEGPAAGAADVGAPAVPPLEKRCEALAIERHLTPREGEVLVLLARGRTLAIVMRDLQIAKGTAQTHIENVYAKLGVHKQQELIDLVEGCELKDEA